MLGCESNTLYKDISAWAELRYVTGNKNRPSGERKLRKGLRTIGAYEYSASLACARAMYTLYTSHILPENEGKRKRGKRRILGERETARESNPWAILDSVFRGVTPFLKTNLRLSSRPGLFNFLRRPPSKVDHNTYIIYCFSDVSYFIDCSGFQTNYPPGNGFNVLGQFFIVNVNSVGGEKKFSSVQKFS